jgi:hypothetical protein
MDKQAEIRNYLQAEFGIATQAGENFDRMEDLLSVYIDELIRNDFSKLVNLLYRIDVSESRLRIVLAENSDRHAGQLIAHLMLERQLQKMESREKFKPGTTATDDEKW